MSKENLFSNVRTEIFCLLFGLNAVELHLREIERRVQFNVATVRHDLHQLADLNLVISRRDGNLSKDIHHRD
jgi:predicted transcriptional regulator